ncbi:helix-turn-helix domain-containing protein [Streptosporangium canum]|uniref:helix-turn-helix domain-containing protein n=1 Tax=Streptosporangium canum TaxID=324952 RepID=UPI0033AA7375
MTRSVLGVRLRAARECKGLSQVDAAAEIGVSQSTMSQWERGVKAPGSDYWESLSRLYDVHLVDLLDEVIELRSPAEKAIDDDPDLTREQKDALLAAYGVFRKKDSLGLSRSMARSRASQLK